MAESIAPTSESLRRDRATWPWYSLPYPFGAILACLSLTLAIQYGNGYYNFFSLRLLMASVILWVLLIPALFLAGLTLPKSKEQHYFATRLLTLPVVALVMLELLLALQDAYIYYNQIPFYPTFVTGTIWITVGLVVTYLLEISYLPAGRLLTLFVKYRFAFIVLLSVLVKFVTIFASYINLIDVGIMMQESSAYLLSGSNPYTSPTAGYGGFNYLPMHLLLPLPFYVIFGDARFGMIIWELVGIGFIYHLVKTELFSPRLVRLSEVVILLFVWQPRSLFIIEQAWGEPLAVGIGAATLYFFYRQPAGPVADILFAVLLAVKQYLVYMGLPIFIFYDFNWKRYATTAVVFILIILPFVVWNPVEFYNRNVLHFFGLPIQTTSLGLTAHFWQQGILIPRWMSPVVAGVVAFGVGFLLKRFGVVGYLHTVVLTFFCLFIFGQQAFANYYYLLSFFQVMAILFFIVSHFAHPDNQHSQLYRGVA